MNLGRGWNPDLEETYFPEYSEYEANMFTQGTSRFYLWSMKKISPYISSIPRYRESTKTTSFSILGIFRLGIKLGSEFPRVLLNQKLRPWCLKFDFFEEINPMLGSLKNSSSVKNPNFPHQKLKILGIKFSFDRKMHPSMES